MTFVFNSSEQLKIFLFSILFNYTFSYLKSHYFLLSNYEDYFFVRFLFRSHPSAGIRKVMCKRSSISISAFFGICDTVESACDKRSANSPCKQFYDLRHITSKYKSICLPIFYQQKWNLWNFFNEIFQT